MTQTNSRQLRLWCLLFLALFTAPLALAQIGGAGSIQGVISDATGAVVPAAAVTATNLATGVKLTRQTTAAGLYVLTPLPPGEYTVSVTATGFKPLVQEKVIVDALSTVGLNLALQVGATTDTVTVTSAPAQLSTSDARLGTTMRNELYTNLPLAMGTAVAGSGIGQGPRNPGAFIFLLPGVSEGNRWGTINGAQGFSKDVFIEGVPITDPIQQGEGRTISLGVSVEAVEQFQVETSGTGVEFNGQGSENYTIKSGKSEFHGSGFEYLRNTSLDARGFFPSIRPVEHQNEFGATIGGPIVKKKAFFFFSYDGWRYRVTSPTQFVSLPTLKMRQGDFTELPVAIYDPLTTVAVAGGFSRTQFSDPTRATTANPLGLNIIPANRISSISKVYQSLLPNPTTTGIANNYLGSVPVAYNNNSYNAKVDYNLTANQRLSGIYTHGKRSQPGPYRETSAGTPQSALPLPYTDTRLVEEIPTVIQGKHSWTINSALVNQLSFGFNHLFVPITNATSDGKWSTKSGLKGLPAGDASDAFLEAAFGGPNAPAGWRGTGSRDFEDNNYNYTLQDSLLWVKNKHSFKFGFQYQRTSDHTKTNDTGSLLTTNFSNLQTAGFNATGGLLSGTGNAYASYLLGALNSATVNEDAVVLTYAQFSSYAWWVADDFKVNSRLTLNLGLRHDIMLPYTERDSYFTFLDITAPNPAAGGLPGALRFGGKRAPSAISCNCDQIINTYYKAFGPRLGFAYAWNDKTVVRGGYGMMYSRSGAVGGRDGARIGTGLTGINANAPIVSPNGSFTPALYWDNGIPAYAKGPIYDQTYQTGFNGTGSGGAVTFGDPYSQPPRYQNWNLSVQRSLTNSLVVTAAYVGSNGKQLRGGGRGIYSNQLDPKYLVLGNLLTQTATPANVTAAAVIVPGVKLPFATFAGTIAQMLRPFPQYNSVSDVYGNVGQSNYNALQLSIQQRLSNGLTFNFNYTRSKALGTINGNRSAYIQEKHLSTTDQPNILNAFYSYELPFGKGRMFEPKNIVARSAVSGWQISGITRYATGAPLGPFTANCNVPQAGTCWASYNPNFTGPVRINGAWGNGNVLGAVAGATPFIDVNAFISPASFTYGNTPATGAYGLRNPHFVNQDLSLSRNFYLHENLKFAFGADAFNIFNVVRFGSINTNITSASFGKVGSQANLPRVFQFKLRLEF
ncbi:MAG: TonB-dependent receptor [Acidobacteria bacterium]|nr:TonB-dependent receptor [Acidobacteriota bacterium]MBI3426404.1 TonB-dependent receptor [Acidobacteriota bacterium]